jgi:hypothetical protein
MNYQAPNFDFIATAGQQAGQAIQGYAKNKNTEYNIKLDDDQASKAHEEIVSKVAEEYMTATGADPVSSYTFAARFFPGKFKSETASEAAQRWLAAEPKYKAALEEAKVQKFHTDSATNKPEPYTRPEGNVSVQQPAASQPGTPEFSKNPTSFGGLAGMQAQALTEGPAAGTMTGPEETPQEKIERAQKLGVGGVPSVASDIQRSRNVQDANSYLPGMTKATYAQAVGQNDGDVEAGIARGIYGGLQSEQQIANNERLKTQEEQRNRMRGVLASLQERKLQLDQKKEGNKEDYALLDAQINLLNTQIKASEQLYNRSMGIGAGTSYTGEKIFVKPEDFDNLYKDSESTLLSAQDLLARVNKKNEKIIPKIQPAAPTKSKFKIISVK